MSGRKQFLFKCIFVDCGTGLESEFEIKAHDLKDAISKAERQLKNASRDCMLVSVESKDNNNVGIKD